MQVSYFFLILTQFLFSVNNNLEFARRLCYN